MGLPFEEFDRRVVSGSYMLNSLFVPQSFDWIQFRCAGSGVEACDQADDNAKAMALVASHHGT